MSAGHERDDPRLSKRRRRGDVYSNRATGRTTAWDGTTTDDDEDVQESNQGKLSGDEGQVVHRPGQRLPFSKPATTTAATAAAHEAQGQLNKTNLAQSHGLHAVHAGTQPNLDPRQVKGKARQLPSSTSAYQLPATDDPLDPLSAFRRPATARLPFSTSEPGGLARLNGATPSRHHTATNSHRPPSTVASYPSSESVASTSLLSLSGPSSTAHGSNAGSSNQQSLQQILQTVDLGAALKLVQTLQTQQQQARQSQQHPEPSPPPVEQLTTNAAPVVPDHAGQGAVAPDTNPAVGRRRGTLLPLLSPYVPINHSPQPSPSSPAQASTQQGSPVDARDPDAVASSAAPLAAASAAKAGKKERRLTISFGGKRARSNSTAGKSPLSSAALRTQQDRIPDERLAMGEYGRYFEGERAIYGHLTLLYSLSGFRLNS